MFTSDHGEEFFEHNYLGHGRALYQESIGVPLVVRWPRSAGVAPARIEVPVSGLQIPATVVEAASLDPASLPGVPLPRVASALWTPVFSEFDRSGVQIYGGRFDRFKLLLTRSPGRDEFLEVFDLQEDPGERTNLASLAPSLPPEVAQAFGAFVDRMTPAEPGHLSADRIEQLRSLGYLQ